MKCIDDEIPFEIPESWEWCRLGMLFSHCTGKALNGINKKGKLYSYITTSNLYWDRFEMSTLKEMYFTDEELDKCTAIKGDLLVCEGGDIGRSAIWNYEYDIRIQNHIHKLRAYLPLCTRFFYHVMFLYKGIGNIGGKGIGIQGLSSKALHNIILPLPPISEQERITAQIETIMPLAAKYEKSQDALNRLNNEISTRLRKSILQEAIQGKLVPQDPNDEPASVLLERIREEKQRLLKEGKLKKKDLVDSVIFKGEDNKYYEQVENSISDITSEIPFDIPESWAWCRMGSLTNLRIGKTPTRGDSSFWQQGIHPWVSISDLTQNNIINSTKEKISDIAAQTIMGPISKAGSLLMSFKLTVGKTGILTIDAYHNEAIVTINTFIDNDFHTRNYLSIILPILTNYGETKDAIKGKTMNSQSLNALLIPLPPLDEQKRMFQKVSLLFSKLTC